MALLKVLLLLVLGVSVNSAVSLQKRIIGGQNCDDSERLYHVRLESSKGDAAFRCGGSLIHPQWILTVSRCWKSEPGWTNRAFLKVHPRTVIKYSQIIQQAPVIYTDDGQQHDMMLLKLQTPVTDVPLARLPDCNYRLKIDNVVQLAGEGATTTGPNNQRLPPGGAISPHLQCVDMRVVGVKLFKPSHGFMFLAQSLIKDICHGDTGGAVVHKALIYGVISFGGQDGCQRPASVLDVCEYEAWIKRITGLK